LPKTFSIEPVTGPLSSEQRKQRRSAISQVLTPFSASAKGISLVLGVSMTLGMIALTVILVSFSSSRRAEMSVVSPASEMAYALIGQALLSPRAHHSLHSPPLSHCEGSRFGGTTKQSQTDNEIATPACHNTLLRKQLRRSQALRCAGTPLGSQ
jgi:hypothetical protein